MDGRLNFRLPPGSCELDSDLDRRCILELTNGTPLAVITADIDSSEIQEAETRQGNGGDDGGISFVTYSPVDRNPHAIILGVLGNTSDRVLALRKQFSILREGVEHRLGESRRASAAK